MEQEDKILLILDIDETLIHARSEKLEREPDFTVFHYAVYKRPFLDFFLKEIQSDFRIAFWSSASDDYVNAIVDTIYPLPNPREFVWGRSRCTPRMVNPLENENLVRYGGFSHYNFIKRIQKIRRHGYSLEKALIVDDTPAKVKNSFGNAIYIREFNGETDDRELEKLYFYLQKLKNEINVRTIEKRGWDSEK